MTFIGEEDVEKMRLLLGRDRVRSLSFGSGEHILPRTLRAERQRAGSCLASCHHGSCLFIAGDSEAVCVLVAPVGGPTPSRHLQDAPLPVLSQNLGHRAQLDAVVWMKIPALSVVEISVTRLHSTSSPRARARAKERKRAAYLISFLPLAPSPRRVSTT